MTESNYRSYKKYRL